MKVNVRVERKTRNEIAARKGGFFNVRVITAVMTRNRKLRHGDHEIPLIRYR